MHLTTNSSPHPRQSCAIRFNFLNEPWAQAKCFTSHLHPSQTLKIPTCILPCPKLGGDNFPRETDRDLSQLGFFFSTQTFLLLEFNLLFTRSNDFDSHTKALCKATKCQLLKQENISLSPSLTPNTRERAGAHTRGRKESSWL